MIPTRPGHNTTLEEALSEEPQFRAEVRNNPQARKLIEYALKLEGTTRSLGIHAGGVLIAPGKLIDFCPLYAAGMLRKTSSVCMTKGRGSRRSGEVRLPWSDHADDY